jgi:hypothetical protein
MSIKDQGRAAFFAGVALADNPFKPTAPVRHRFWVAGWKKAQKDARPLTQADFAKRTVTGRTPSQPEIQELPKPAAKVEHDEIVEVFKGGNPDRKLLASTSGLISALKTCRETPKSWYVTYYGEGDKEVRISKTDPRRRICANMAEAEAWARGEGVEA